MNFLFMKQNQINLMLTSITKAMANNSEPKIKVVKLKGKLLLCNEEDMVRLFAKAVTGKGVPEVIGTLEKGEVQRMSRLIM